MREPRTIDHVFAEMDLRANIIADPTPDGYKCKTCGSILQQTTGYASVHDGPFPLSGSGRVKHYPYPYCPKCEPNPSTPRTFIDVD